MRWFAACNTRAAQRAGGCPLHSNTTDPLPPAAPTHSLNVLSQAHPGHSRHGSGGHSDGAILPSCCRQQCVAAALCSAPPAAAAPAHCHRRRALAPAPAPRGAASTQHGRRRHRGCGTETATRNVFRFDSNSALPLSKQTYSLAATAPSSLLAVCTCSPARLAARLAGANSPVPTQPSFLAKASPSPRCSSLADGSASYSPMATAWDSCLLICC